MTWEPDVGFHIEASSSRNGTIDPKKITFGGETVETIPNILLKPQGYDRAVAMPVTPINPLTIFLSKRLSVNCNRVVFFQNSRPSLNTKDFRASAVYNVGGNPVFPDSLYTETHIKYKNGDRKIASSAARTAIWYEDPQGKNLSGHMISKDTFNLNWVFPNENYTKKDCWNWAESFRYALSILSGQTVQLLQREMEIGSYKRTEKKKRKFAKTLWPLKPFPYAYQLHKEYLIKLAEFFSSESKESYVCRNIFNQMANASQQQTLEGAQLLLSTILEAALRTLYNHPFSENSKDTFKRSKCMNQFKKAYLGTEWSEDCKKALDVFERLRHRNAHPDWLISESGTWSSQALEKDLDDMVFLSQFYGYMIKALAGYKNMQPNFRH